MRTLLARVLVGLVAVGGIWGNGAPAAASEKKPAVLSVVAVRNRTAEPITYELRWPGAAWKSFTVQPKQAGIHWAGGAGKRLEVRFHDNPEDDGAQRTQHLFAADFANGSRKPRKTTDGLIYAFSRTDKGTLALRAETPLDKGKFKDERNVLETKFRTSHPNLLTNYEVLGPSELKKKTYNCIAWSVGIKDHWVWPGKNLEDFDKLYAKYGYRRTANLDFAVRKGQQKIVLYGKNLEDGTVECTHAARQEPNGTYTSKLGKMALIRHLHPEDVDGPSYGRPVAVYVRQAKQR